MPRVLALITARGGSKGLPGKNVRPLLGRPLIAWSITAAIECRSVDRVIVSTDDEVIAKAARDGGAEVPFLRPSELAQDGSSHISVVEHALDWLRERESLVPDYLLLLQPTCPLRTSEDIEAAVALALEKKARAVVSVCEPRHHPFALKRLTPEGTLADFMPSGLAYARRQDFPAVWAVNGAIYLTQPAVLRNERTFEPADTIPYLMPQERSIDIDTLWDFQLAEMILQHRRSCAAE